MPGTRLQEPDTLECLVVNTTGELMSFYGLATVVFIGKSLTAFGGQNPIEPAAIGKPVVFGPNMQNFADIIRLFKRKNSVVQVRDAAELERVFGELLADADRRAKLGRAAQAVVAENLGAVDRTTDMILEQLRTRGIYVAPENTSP